MHAKFNIDIYIYILDKWKLSLHDDILGNFEGDMNIDEYSDWLYACMLLFWNPWSPFNTVLSIITTIKNARKLMTVLLVEAWSHLKLFI